MSTDVVVLGSGYGGAAAIQSLESCLDDATLTWVSKDDYHLLLHESHRLIRNPKARETVTIPIDEIKSSSTRFVRAEVTGIDVDAREVSLADGSSIDYDYVVICLGSRTAFYGIDGLREHALTMKSLADALAIREQLVNVVREASGSDRAQVVVGGGGLTGIQVAGEIAQVRNDHDLPLDVKIVEMSDQIFAGHDNEFEGAIRNQLERHDVEIDTGTVVTGVDDETIEFDEADSIEYDLFVWAGGVAGQSALESADLSKDHNRVYADPTLETANERVFALGDSALVDQDEEGSPLSEEAIWEMIVQPDADSPVPPTAEAAWEAGEVLGKNVARAIDGRELIDWTYVDKGTAVSIGEAAVAHGVLGVPINTFSGPGAVVLKKLISVRWIGDITTWRRALRAWPDM